MKQTPQFAREVRGRIARSLKRVVRVQKPCTGRTCIRMRLQECRQGFEGPIPNDRIRIEQQHILPFAQANRPVICPRKAGVFLVFYEMNSGKASLDPFWCSVP